LISIGGSHILILELDPSETFDNNSPMTASTKSSRLNRSDLRDALRLSLKTLGLAGSLALVGYIALVAHLEFLGLQTDVNDVAQLSFAAAAFCFESVRIVLQAATVHWIWSVFWVVILAILLWASQESTFKSHRIRLIWEIGVISILILISGSALLLYELPTINLKDALILAPCAQPGVGMDNLTDRRSNHLWSLIVDSRGGMTCPTQEVGAPPHNDPDTAKSELRASYVLTLTAVVIAWLAVYSLGSKSSQRWLAPLWVLVALGLGLNTLLLPYAYGKLMSPTSMPAVGVRLLDPAPATGQGGARPNKPRVSAREESAKDADQPKIPAPGEGCTDTNEEWLAGTNLLISESDKSILVLNLDSGSQTSRLCEIPRAEIKRLEITDIKDALVEKFNLQKSVPILGD
jgi:hypothetical protein